jgi:hypothetical protein
MEPGGGSLVAKTGRLKLMEVSNGAGRWEFGGENWPPMPLYRPDGDLNDQKECSHRRRSAPSLLRLLLGRGGDTLVINFGSGNDQGDSWLCAEEAAGHTAGGVH